ncbi:MAG TPA: hypothetical protein VKV33_10120 [Streptosporangiaceae bacterium]|jgi:hypothetical protein|nr:hypothetical protein [Streptosporangiaceae bacterium]
MKRTGDAAPVPSTGSAEPGPRGLPLLRARNWAIAFLLFAIVLAAVLAQTMPAFFRAAYHLG